MDPASSVKLAATILKEAKKQGLIDKIIAAFKAKPRIVVLGCTGAGKTNFLKSLTDISVEPIRKEDRTLYTEAKNLVLNKQNYRFIDTTGDALRSDDRNQAIREAMSARGGIAGIINVVSYGYHEYHVPTASVFSADDQIRQDFLQRHRDEEIKQLSEWTSLIGDPITSGWLITVVTKADLWWNEREAVMKHYTEGPYFEGLGSAKQLKQRVVEYSSVFHKFYGRAPMAGSFDDENHKVARDKVVNAIIKALLKHQGA